MTILHATEHESLRSHMREVSRETLWKDKYAAIKAELTAALLREEGLLRDKSDLLQCQDMLTQEFEHRLVNSLQLIVSLLLMQSRAATTVESAAQLAVAARRVGAFGRVHRRLHLLDQQKNVEFQQYLHDLCDDLSGLLFPEGSGRTVVVAGANVTLPTSLGIPLGFIVSELITNSSKYAEGDITVRIERSAAACSVSVMDDGPGLPADFSPAPGKSLGMKIIQALVKQIGGTLRFTRGDDGRRGPRVTVTFEPPLQGVPKPMDALPAELCGEREDMVAGV
jgi:two-component sensor histidine kinase